MHGSNKQKQDSLVIIFATDKKRKLKICFTLVGMFKKLSPQNFNTINMFFL